MGAVTLTDDYRVDVEDKQFTLQRRGISVNKTTKEKTVVWTSEGYFGNWDNLLEKLSKLFVAEKVDKEGLVTLKEFKEILKEVRDEIKNIGNQLN